MKPIFEIVFQIVDDFPRFKIFLSCCLKNINLGIVRGKPAFFDHREASLSSQPL